MMKKKNVSQVPATHGHSENGRCFQLLFLSLGMEALQTQLPWRAVTALKLWSGSGASFGIRSHEPVNQEPLGTSYHVPGSMLRASQALSH